VTRRQPERAEQAAIVKLLRSLGATVYVLGTTRRKGDHPGTMQTPGIPDLYVFLPYRLGLGRTALWLEVKATNGKPSSAQSDFRRHCKEALHEHVMGTCDDVQNWLVDYGWLPVSQRRP
jgi:hypothetical protein